MKQELISEAQKYGLAMFFLSVAVIGLCIAVVTLWKNQNKRESQNADLIKENTIAFKDLQHTINLLITKL